MKQNHPFYRTERWRKLRRIVRLDAGHKCQACGREVEGKQGNVHHHYPVAQHYAVRFEPLNLRYLCVSCHRNEERNPLRGCDEQGFPRDRNHPCYASTGSALRAVHTGGRVQTFSPGEPEPRGAPIL